MTGLKLELSDEIYELGKSAQVVWFTIAEIVKD